MAFEDVVWASVQATCTATGTTIEKVSGDTDTPNGGAISTQSITGDGAIQFVMPDTNKALTAGLGTDVTADYTLITHGWSFNGAGTAEIRELAVYKSETSYSANDTFKIGIVGGVVTYYRNGASVYTSLTAATLPTKFDVSITTLNGKITTAQLDGAAAAQNPTVPTDYNAITDRIVRSDAIVPALGAAGYTFSDPNFLCPVLRVTDGNTALADGSPQNYAYRTPSAPNQCCWNSDGTKFYVLNDSATCHYFNFNRSSMTATYDRKLAWGIEPAWSKLTTKPKIQYGVRFINGHVIEKWDFDNPGAGYVEVLDLKDIDGTLDSNVYTSQIYTSSGPVERAVVNYGGAGQNLHMKVSMFNIDDPIGTIRTINMTTDTINGVGLLDQNGNPFTFGGVLSHSISISPDGNTLRIDPVNTVLYFWIYDWTLNRIKKEMAKPAGHYALGRGLAINEDATDSSKPQWQYRSLALANSSTTTARITTPVSGVIRSGDHVSWHNACQVGNENVPFFSDWQKCFDDPFTTWSNEIIGIRAVGAEKVWRFCHHHMNPDGDVGGNTSQPFKYQVILNADPLGQFVLFTSNWNKTLGNDAAGGDADSIKRTDVFMVKLEISILSSSKMLTMGVG